MFTCIVSVQECNTNKTKCICLPPFRVEDQECWAATTSRWPSVKGIGWYITRDRETPGEAHDSKHNNNIKSKTTVCMDAGVEDSLVGGSQQFTTNPSFSLALLGRAPLLAIPRGVGHDASPTLCTQESVDVTVQTLLPGQNKQGVAYLWRSRHLSFQTQKDWPSRQRQVLGQKRSIEEERRRESQMFETPSKCLQPTLGTLATLLSGLALRLTAMPKGLVDHSGLCLLARLFSVHARHVVGGFKSSHVCGYVGMGRESK